MTGASGSSLRSSASTVSPPTPESNSRIGAAGSTGAGWPNPRRRSTERRSALRLALLPPADRYLLGVEARVSERQVLVEAQLAVGVGIALGDVGGLRHRRVERDRPRLPFEP